MGTSYLWGNSGKKGNACVNYSVCRRLLDDRQHVTTLPKHRTSETSDSCKETLFYNLPCWAKKPYLQTRLFWENNENAFEWMPSIFSFSIFSCLYYWYCQ